MFFPFCITIGQPRLTAYPKSALRTPALVASVQISRTRWLLAVRRDRRRYRYRAGAVSSPACLRLDGAEPAKGLEAPEIGGIVIHPAMVYAAGGGVFHRFAQDAVERGAIRVVEGEPYTLTAGARRRPRDPQRAGARACAGAIELYRRGDRGLDVGRIAAAVRPNAQNEKPACQRAFVKLCQIRETFGAGEGARTLDPDLGKVVLYH
jgi:hypothetical protein